MDKNYVFDTNTKYFYNILKASVYAKLKGYEFMLFNDIVYFIDESNIAHTTLITTITTENLH